MIASRTSEIGPSASTYDQGGAAGGRGPDDHAECAPPSGIEKLECEKNVCYGHYCVAAGQ